MTPLSWILVITGIITGAIILGWLMMLSLNQRDSRDDWP